MIWRCHLLVTALGFGFLVVSCNSVVTSSANRAIETRFAFANLSRTAYATIKVRDAAAKDSTYASTPLLAPGAIFRADFQDLLGVGCPDSVDLQILHYRRVNDSVPIGLDAMEAVEETPIVAGEVLGLPACSTEPLVTYTVVNWDAPQGVARVKVAQASAVEDAIRAAGIFDNVDAVWEVEGVDPTLTGTAPPQLAINHSVSGRVTLADGEGVAGIGVLLRTRFRVRFDDDIVTNDPDAGFSDPLAFTVTDETGAFSIDRPAGGYQLEFFSDDFVFRPASVFLETPIRIVQVLAEAR